MEENLLNPSMIQKKIAERDQWAEGHGYVEKWGYLGTSLLYYTLAYILPARVAVVLGSGSGFVPRLIRQAQREIPLENTRTILIDAGISVYDFGVADYHDSCDHYFRTSYPEIEIWKITTDKAFKKLQEEKISIDYLHIDADHTFEQSLKDFENYLTLMEEDFAITLHDTAIGHLENFSDGCVAHTIAYLRNKMQEGEKYSHLEMINFNHRYKNPKHPFYGEMRCRGTAVVMPKAKTFWDMKLTEFLN